MNSKIILPLDNVPWDNALGIMQKTKGLVWGYKIRRSILERGLKVIKEIKNFGSVMLDFKLYDIPSAMTESLKLHIDASADITTIHCTSGYQPESEGLSKDHIAGVTILTSMDQNDFNRYYQGGSLLKMVGRMAQDALPYYEYLVCSAQDLELIHELDIKKICPGIRPRWYLQDDDQERTATPAEAIKNGADLLVIGRPILKSDDIVGAVQRTNAEVAGALE
jgi:orotidine-5'-phosphate decarboxylase